jgi:hypothetical protein
LVIAAVLSRRETMTPREILDFVRAQRLAVEATVAASGAPQAAMIGIGVSERLELVFDTLGSTRKAVNFRSNPRMALVIGGFDPKDPRTVQYEGIADEPSGAELERVKALYFEAYPDGPSRASWPGITYVRVRPTWLRYSDYRTDPPIIVELDEAALRGLG